MKLLLIASRSSASKILKETLNEYYSVALTNDYHHALSLAEDSYVDGIILDAPAFGKDSLRFLSELRSKGICTPLLLITEMGDITTMLEGFNQGADNCLTSPYNHKELLARLRAMLRSKEYTGNGPISFGEIIFDPACATLTSYKKRTVLNKIEGQLLELFILNPWVAYSAKDLCRYLWGSSSILNQIALAMQLWHLRQKVSIACDCTRITAHMGHVYSLDTIPTDRQLYF